MAAAKYYVYASASGLQITDGTAAGTQTLKADATGFDANIWMSLLGTSNEVVFGASAGGTGMSGAADQLWMTDGTSGGTKLVTTLPTLAPTGSSNDSYGITGVTSFGAGVLFNYSTGNAADNSLYYSDGTAAGTISLPDSQNAFGSPAAVLNGRMLFVSASGLCETDGTVAGTAIIRAANTASGGFVPDSSVFSLGNGHAMFLASAGAGVSAGGTAGINQLWITDGTAAGTSLVTTLPDHSGASESALGFVVGTVAGKAVFSYNDGSTGYNLYVSDGTAGGTLELPDSSSAFGGVAAPGGKFVFVSASGICVTDGTVAGTSVLKAASSSFDPVGNFSILASGDVLFTAGPGGVSGQFGQAGGNTQLWVTDGTASGTTLVETLPDQSGSTTADTATLDPVGGLAAGYVLDYATGGSGQTGGLNLYGSSGTVASTVELPNSANSLNLADYDTAFLPCFARGTHIATRRGDVAVEGLVVGDIVPTATGQALPIRWLGHRRVAIGRHAAPDRVAPVRVAAHAFAQDVPLRDLWLSPDHAVFADGVLIPIKHLINGRSVAQLAVDVVEYWHVELAQHAVLFAEGLAAESYLDTGNRAAFANGADWIVLHPDFAALSWDGACAELVEDGERVMRLKQRLFERCPPSPQSARALSVTAGGAALVPEILKDDRWRYAVPRGTTRLYLDSPTWMPAAEQAASLDRRRLGVRLFAIMIDGREVDLDADALTGCHPTETTAEGPCRWTAGAAQLKLPPGARHVTLHVGDAASFPAILAA